jgi:hypothetical protein
LTQEASDGFVLKMAAMGSPKWINTVWFFGDEVINFKRSTAKFLTFQAANLITI